jgi:hypothetical protein
MTTRYQRGNQRLFVCSSIYSLWLPLWYLVVIILSVPRFTDSGYPFGILWSLYCLSLDLQPLITPLVSCGHCIVCPSIYSLWLLLWYLVVILSVPRFTASDYLFGILWSSCLFWKNCSFGAKQQSLTHYIHTITTRLNTVTTIMTAFRLTFHDMISP